MRGARNRDACNGATPLDASATSPVGTSPTPSSPYMYQDVDLISDIVRKFGELRVSVLAPNLAIRTAKRTP